METRFNIEKLAYIVMPFGVAFLLLGQFFRNDTLEMIGGFTILPFLVFAIFLMLFVVLGGIHDALFPPEKDASIPNEERHVGDDSSRSDDE